MKKGERRKKAERRKEEGGTRKETEVRRKEEQGGERRKEEEGRIKGGRRKRNNGEGLFCKILPRKNQKFCPDGGVPIPKKRYAIETNFGHMFENEANSGLVLYVCV